MNNKKKYKYLFIYKTTNLINGKIYIGQRFTDDLNDGYIGCGVQKQNHAILDTYFHRAVRKYGYENFKREVLEFCETRKELNEREKFWIKELNTRNEKIGYNMTCGGEGGDCISNNPNYEQIRKNMSKSMTGKKKSEEHRRHNREANTGRFNKKHTQDEINRMVKSRSWYKHSKETKQKQSKSWDKRQLIICPHCGKQSKSAARMKQWHFDNCKHKQKVA